MTVLERFNIRKPNIDNDALINEFIYTIKDRIKLIYSIEEFPEELDSVVLEIAIMMFNESELNHEGVKEEKVDVFSIKFVNDKISLFNKEISGYLWTLEKTEIDKDDNFGKLRFL